MLRIGTGREIPCICVTNRALCRGDFLARIEKIAGEGEADAIVLREKDLPEREYDRLAEQVLDVCGRSSVPCILHSDYRTAMRRGCPRIHVPLGILRDMDRSERSFFTLMGTSVHSVEQAREAEELGADYVIAGHVFETDCKKGLPGRGLRFIREVVEEVRIPVYGIGGIDRHNASSVVAAGARGICMMSSFMFERRCES